MMKKKLLIFMLVLGMASMASAVIVSPIQVNNESGWPIELPSGMSSAIDDMSGGYWALISSSTPGTPTADSLNPITGGTLTALAPDASGIYGDAGDSTLFAYGVGVYGFFGSYSQVWSSAAGVYADSFGGTAEYASLYLIDNDFTVATHVMTTPEPATIALLGLGGLLLRRRK